MMEPSLTTGNVPRPAFTRGRITFLIILSSIVGTCLQGCMSLESVTTNWPHVEDARVDYFNYGDGIALKLPTLCFAIQEGGSAVHRIEYIGPLIFTVFPLSAQYPVAAGYYEIKLDFLPAKENAIRFDPRLATLHFDDGSAVQPYAYRIWHFYSEPGPVVSVEGPTEGIVLRTTITRVFLRFQKPKDTAQVSKLILNGLKNETEAVDVPVVLFEPRQAHYRYRWPSRGNNLDVKCR